MKNVGTVVYVFDNGVSTMYTLPNAIINDDMQNKHYIVYTASKTSFDIMMHFGDIPVPRQVNYRNHDNNAEQVRQFLNILDLSLWELLKSNDVANIYKLITNDILELTYSGIIANEAGFKYHYCNDCDNNTYFIKIMRDVNTFVISVTNITSDK